MLRLSSRNDDDHGYAPVPSTTCSAVSLEFETRHYAQMSMDASDREQRQYALMKETIDGFRGGRDIGPVIADLEVLVNVLEETPQEWKDSFVEEWSVLEVAHAVALDRSQSLPAAGDHDIAAALEALDALIALRIGNPG
jgi:hypothetical protein